MCRSPRAEVTCPGALISSGRGIGSETTERPGRSRLMREASEGWAGHRWRRVPSRRGQLEFIYRNRCVPGVCSVSGTILAAWPGTEFPLPRTERAQVRKEETVWKVRCSRFHRGRRKQERVPWVGGGQWPLGDPEGTSAREPVFVPRYLYAQPRDPTGGQTRGGPRCLPPSP